MILLSIYVVPHSYSTSCGSRTADAPHLRGVWCVFAGAAALARSLARMYGWPLWMTLEAGLQLHCLGYMATAAEQHAEVACMT